MPFYQQKTAATPTHSEGDGHFSLNCFPDDGLALSSVSPLLFPVLFRPNGQGV